MKIKNLLLTLVFLLSACSSAEVTDYIHQPTQELRDSIIHSGQQEVSGIHGREFIIVPDFSTFSRSYSINQARLIIVSERTTSISIKEARLIHTDSGESELIELNQQYEVATLVPGAGVYLGFVPLLDIDFADYEHFNQAKELDLVISYRIAGGELKTQTMRLKLVTRNDIAWVT
ncbi:hypothetical protein [Aliidiomarina soli]|uniref:DUF4426 domain-containing protein n=1 Tax=Aliidiomarina soli TaxID=1928574 RepID=A0A432WM49_9GAMM|nr:hypothetical protein [Aliidiomarina soli]RUO34855.1 hypothetical protein CWE14_02330 [Aliidiomarina soli]